MSVPQGKGLKRSADLKHFEALSGYDCDRSGTWKPSWRYGISETILVGVGQFAYESVIADYPAIIGVALLIALNYMIINTVVDILYGIIDPREVQRIHSLKNY
ncbi:MAG: hypothetical protein ACLUV8_14870 [Clostridium sp.]